MTLVIRGIGNALSFFVTLASIHYLWPVLGLHMGWVR